MKLHKLAIPVSALTLALSANSWSANFVDVTSEAGLSGFALGAGWGDYDNDGCADVLSAGLEGAKLMKNNCDGTFTDVTAASGITMTDGSWGVAWADYDNDGFLDVYIGGGNSDPAKLFHSNGDGSFTDVTVSSGLLNVPNGHIGVAGASWADFDLDGDLDLFTAGRFGGGDLSDQLWLNNGDGTFTDIAVQAGVDGGAERQTFMGVWFDYDMDGDDDLYVAVDFNPDVLYANNGDGTFTDVSLEAGIAPPGHGMGVAVGDFNNDGCFDVFSSNNGRPSAGSDELDDHGPSILYVNNCDGTFDVSTYAVGVADRGVVEWGLNFVDYDNDGDLDFTVVAGGMLVPEGEPNAFYENDGDGNLTNITADAGLDDLSASFGSLWIDYDNDGDLDWYVVNENAKESTLYRNDSAVGHYLKVELECTTDNIDCVGAEIEVTAGTRKQIRVLQAGVSYAGSEPITAHFGLGVKDLATSVAITWPDGTFTQLTDVAADQMITVVQEDTSEPPPEPDENIIVGVVVEELSGTPLEGINVYLRPVEGGSALYREITDASGAFEMTEVPPGEYNLLASLAGEYRSDELTLTMTDGDVISLTVLAADTNPDNDVDPPEDPPAVTEGDIFGVAAAADGTPIAGAIVYLRAQGSGGPAFANTVTDASGAYSFSAVPVGDWEILGILSGQWTSGSQPFTLSEAELEFNLLMDPIP